MAKGALTLSSSYLITGTAKNPYGVVTAPNGKNLYVIASGDPNGSPAYVGSGVVQLAINQSTGALSQIASKPLFVATSQGPRHAAIPPDGKNLYVAVAGNSDIYNFVIDQTDGSLTSGTNVSFPGTATPSDIHASYDNAHVYVACASGSYGNLIRVYSRDGSGNLTQIQTVALTGAFSLRCSKDGTAVFAVSNTNSRVYWYARDNNPASGTYGQLTWVTDAATPSNFPDKLVVSDDSLYVYVSTDSNSQFTGCFKRNSGTNTLDDLGHPAQTTDNNGGPWSIALSNDVGNTAVYVAISDAMRIAQYTRSTTDTTNGGLTPMSPGSVLMSNWSSGSNAGQGPYDLSVSPDNKFLYATAIGSQTIDIFSIAPDPAAQISGSSSGTSSVSGTLVLGVMLQGTATGTSTTAPVLTFASPGIKATDRVNVDLIVVSFNVSLI